MNYDVKTRNVYITRGMATEINRRLELGTKEADVARDLKVDKNVVRIALKSKNGNINFNPISFCFSSHFFLDLTDSNIAIARRVSLADPLPEQVPSPSEEDRERDSGLTVLERVRSLLHTFPLLSFEALYAHIKSYEDAALSKPAFRRLLRQTNHTVLSGVVLPELSLPLLEWRKSFCDGLLALSQNAFVVSQWRIEMPVSFSGRSYISKSPKESSLFLLAGVGAQGLSSLLVFDEESTKDRESFCMDVIQGLLPGLRLLLRSEATPSVIAIDVEAVSHPTQLVEAFRAAFSGAVLCFPGSHDDLNPMREVWSRLTGSVRPELFCYSKAHSLIRTLRIQWAEMRANRANIAQCWKAYVGNYQQVARAKGNYCKAHYLQVLKERALDKKNE